MALQSDIDLLEEWSNTWLLKFHPDKCHVLTTGKFENIQYTHRYRVYGRELEHVFEEKDLGVVIDSNLNFEDHIIWKVNKANSITHPYLIVGGDSCSRHVPSALRKNSLETKLEMKY